MQIEFVRIGDELLDSIREENASILIDRCALFQAKVRESAAIQAEINVVTKHLQTKYRTLSYCGDIDIL